MNLGAVVLLLPLCFCVLQLEWIGGGVEATGIGVNLGLSVGSESAEDLVHFLSSRGIGKIRLHDADWALLRAIGSSREASMEVIVGVRNEEIVDLGVSPASAHGWLSRNVVPYLPETNVTAIAVGNEVITSEQSGKNTIEAFLVPAMRNLYNALCELGLETRVKISAPQSARALSAATFNGDIANRVMSPLLEFLASSGSYFMVNLYPRDLQRNGDGLKDFSDPQTGQGYVRMLGVLTDALSVAMASLGHDNPIDVRGIEMEWSKNGASPASTSPLAIDIPLEGLGGVGIDHNPGKRSGVNPPVERMERKEVRASAFSSRRFLGDFFKVVEDEIGKRRRLGPNKSWCVANSSASTDALQAALNWACGPGGGVDCEPLQAGQSCYLPNTIDSHASYAFNLYYQAKNWATDSCDFNGNAVITNSDPSTPSCLYSSSTSSNGSPSTPTGTIVPSGSPETGIGSRLAWDRCRFMVTTLVFVFLIRRGISVNI